MAMAPQVMDRQVMVTCQGMAQQVMARQGMAPQVMARQVMVTCQDMAPQVMARLDMVTCIMTSVIQCALPAPVHLPTNALHAVETAIQTKWVTVNVTMDTLVMTVWRQATGTVALDVLAGVLGQKHVTVSTAFLMLTEMSIAIAFATRTGLEMTAATIGDLVTLSVMGAVGQIPMTVDTACPMLTGTVMLCANVT
jgi:hypothetical protein